MAPHLLATFNARLSIRFLMWVRRFTSFSASAKAIRLRAFSAISDFASSAAALGSLFSAPASAAKQKRVIGAPAHRRRMKTIH